MQHFYPFLVDNVVADIFPGLEYFGAGDKADDLVGLGIAEIQRQ